MNVLTEKAAKVFRFEEQNQLHEEIIDTGLAQIYQSHLEVGERMASEMGIEIKKTLLDGKPFQKIVDHARKTNPWLLVLGRIGVHSSKDEKALGSNVENVLRAASCDVLLSTRLEVPRLDVRAEETVRWTPEAEARMTRVPEQVKGIARTGVLRLALEKGHSVITNAVIDDAMDRFMPKSASAATKALAEAVALERAKSGPVSMCKSCGVAATQSGAVKCTVCGSTDFEVISQEMIEKIAAAEGGLEEETTYDGRKLRWSEDARKGLWTMKNAYLRRRVKARVEKRARMTKLDTITLEFARQVIEEETGAPLEIQSAPAPSASAQSASAGEAKLVARDDKKNPLISVFEWAEDATQRILRVPAGFMRNKTQERVEGLARERALTAIDLGLVEEGIEIGKKIMAEVIANYPTAGKGAAAAAPTPGVPAARGERRGVEVAHEASAARTIAEAQSKAQVVPAGNGSGYLNEVSSLTVRTKSGDDRES
ncbi:MAG: universal stress protein [Gemmatimonadaceae bacterium]|nr:universal stress protein [Gemmatimonadaceae bacterium]